MQANWLATFKMIQVADYVFPASRFRMVAADSREFVADFDVQTFGSGKWPVVATIGPKGTTWSVYAINGGFIYAAREQNSDGSEETYKELSMADGVVALPEKLEDGQRWAWEEEGWATYTSPSGAVERGSFVYRNVVWETLEAAPPYGTSSYDVEPRLYWLEHYTENYGAGDVVYERLHVHEKGVGLVAYCDLQWPGGPKWVVRSG